MPKEVFIVRNPITLQAAILDCSEAAVHSHPFLKISPEFTVGRVLFSQITDWLFRVAIIYYSDFTNNVFLEIFRKFLERLNIIKL